MTPLRFAPLCLTSHDASERLHVSYSMFCVFIRSIGAIAHEEEETGKFVLANPCIEVVERNPTPIEIASRCA